MRKCRGDHRGEGGWWINDRYILNIFVGPLIGDPLFPYAVRSFKISIYTVVVS